VYLEVVNILDLADHIILQVEDLQLPADMPNYFDLLKALPLQGDLLQRGEHSVVVFCSLQLRIPLTRLLS